MAGVRSPWLALRPLFIGGAAAFAWLTLSSTPAAADLLPDTIPVISQSAVQDAAPDILAPAVEPVVEVAAPVLDSAEPTLGYVEPILEPVAPIVEPVVEAVVEPAIAPIVETIVQPIAEPILAPVTELAEHTPLPAAVQVAPMPAKDPPAAPAEETSPAVVPAPAGAGWAAQQLPVPSALTDPAVWTGPGVSSGSDAADPVPPSSPSGPVPAAPGSGGASSGGPSPGSAAWLSPVHLDFPFLGAVSAPEFVPHAPEPVSFDPGSSPD